MGRGRNPSTSETQILLEIFLSRDRAVFGVEIAERVPIGGERVRQILQELESEGLVDKRKVSGRNIYRLTDEGYGQLADELRDAVSQ